MSFWPMFALALGILWMQGVVILLVGLDALRADLRNRWEASLHLERLFLSQLCGSEGVLSQESRQAIARMQAVLETRLLPENPEAVAAFSSALAALHAHAAEFRRLLENDAARLGLSPWPGVLLTRRANAHAAWREAVAKYEAHRTMRWLGPVPRWLGYERVVCV